MDETPPWPSDWLRGVLEVCVLRVLADGPTYGYAITAALADGELGTVKGGTLYPLLKRFEGSGWVSTAWRAGEGGPGRKYYELTDTGRAALHERSAQWLAFARVTSRFVAHAARPAGAAPTTANEDPAATDAHDRGGHR
ncbi:PadR family transcriptional regulator [Puerhibacterium sp. TATVAM-FAB25]|uniref:PadR family transcriptional regulator n=1 Tax=Puerhibacterium sp. TATVAM-FAB25 TaxID=3093699 RepID=UPI00397DCE69